MNTQEIAKSIALEAHALENVLNQSNLDYHSTGLKMGKSWFAVGLESNDNDTAQDGEAKKGIIRRMIEAMVNFIRKIVERIKQLFSRTPKEKVDEAIRADKAWHGPTDEDLVKDLAAWARQSMQQDAELQAQTERLKKSAEESRKRNAEFNAKSDEMLSRARESSAKHKKLMDDIKRMNAGQMSLDEAIDNLNEQFSGKAPKKENFYEMTVNARAEHVVNGLDTHARMYFCRGLDPEFVGRVKENSGYIEKLLRAGGNVDLETLANTEEYSFNIIDNLDKMDRAMKSTDSAYTEADVQLPRKWVGGTGGGAASLLYMTGYYGGSKITELMEILQTRVQALEKEENTDEVKEKIGYIKNQLTALSRHSFQMSMLSDAFTKAVTLRAEALKKFAHVGEHAGK